MLLQSGLSLKKQHEMNFKLVPHVTFKIINENEEYWESPYFYTGTKSALMLSLKMMIQKSIFPSTVA